MKKVAIQTILFLILITFICTLLFVFSSISKKNQEPEYIDKLKNEYEDISNGIEKYLKDNNAKLLSDTPIWPYIDDRTMRAEQKINKQDKKGFKKEFSKIFNVEYEKNSENVVLKYNRVYGKLIGSKTFKVKEQILLKSGALIEVVFVSNVEANLQCGRHYCISENEFQKFYKTPTKMFNIAAIFAIDSNGEKGPNIESRDLHHFYIDNYGKLYPIGGADAAVYEGCKYDELKTCDSYWKVSCNKKQDDELFNFFNGTCTGRVVDDGWKMKY